MRAKNLTEPTKKKCSNEGCNGDLPNTTFAPPVKSAVTNKEICAQCKVDELIGSIRSRSMEV